ncbi:NADP-dependent oxidoreductase domain-containing protein [Lasiosphaeria ovina]|uniref:NADP-dependent oxidoreductase domain-containing protein n=1 Tax=Lasiosphaeria ovina TaxID=92902 RepID=A0AAE0MXX7_9PEZI|nr:NADP-dependent oxidoreductase domain-containing protein [Lasiosphaeria ovina]
MAIPTRTLGRNGPTVPALGLGAMTLGVAAYGSSGSQDGSTAEEKLKLLDRAYEIGQRFWDTADVYVDSEDLIGQWFKKTGKRADIFLASKFGLDYTNNIQTVNTDPEYVRFACERSLKKLGIDTIDLYYSHRVSDKTPIEKTIEAMVELKKEGKIRYLGLSEVSAATIRRAHAVHPIAAVQMEYSPFCLEIESPQIGVLQTCRELGIAVVAYSPMGRGLLTGQIRSWDDLPADDFFRRNTPKYSAENFPKILRLVEAFEAVAAAHSCTAAQACLAWLIAQGDDVIPIPGTKTVKYLEQNTAAASIKLTPEEIKELRRVAEATNLPGERGPIFFMAPAFGDTPEL